MDELPKPEEYQIIRKLANSQTKESDDALVEIVEKYTIKKIIKNLNDGKTDIRDLAETLYTIEDFTCSVIRDLMDSEFVEEEVKLDGSNRIQLYNLTKTGKKFYQDVYEFMDI